MQVVKSAEMTDAYFCTGIFAPWGAGKTKLWNLIKEELTKDESNSNKDKSGDNDSSGGTIPIKYNDGNIDWDTFFGRGRLYNLKCILFGIVDKICFPHKDNDDVLPTQGADDVLLLAHEMERNEAVAVLFVILSPIWIVMGVLIGLLQSYGKCVGLCFALNTLTPDKYGSLNSLL